MCWKTSRKLRRGGVVSGEVTIWTFSYYYFCVDFFVFRIFFCLFNSKCVKPELWKRVISCKLKTVMWRHRNRIYNGIFWRNTSDRVEKKKDTRIVLIKKNSLDNTFYNIVENQRILRKFIWNTKKDNKSV